MQNTPHKFLVILAAILSLTAHAQTSIEPSNEHIQYFGRFDWVNNKPVATWPSVYLKANFTGTGITANFSSTTGNVHVVYTIDHGPVQYVNDVSSFTVSGLANGPHQIMISRRNENNGAALTFNGFTIENGDISPYSEDACLRYEFVGNSITAGLANENFDPIWDDGNGTWVADGWEQNSFQSWGPKLARDMGAEYRVEAHSGQGMAVNLYNSLPTVQMSNEWELSNFYPGWDKSGWDTPWDFSTDPWKPDFFFCKLGTNDWSGSNVSDGVITEQIYVDRYNAFIDLIYAKYPDVTFIALSTIFDVQGWATGNAALEQLVSTRKANGDDIYFVDMRNILNQASDFGNDWTHPTTVGQQTMADKVNDFMTNTAAITNKMESITQTCGTDCNGELGGSAYLDQCEQCVGGNTGVESSCTLDCNNQPDGLAYVDSCGQCVGGSTGLTANQCKDCSGTINGEAFEDDCNQCVGGSTGEVACGYAGCKAVQFTGTENEYTGFSGWGNMSHEVADDVWTITGTAVGQWDAGILNLSSGVDFTQTQEQKIWVRAKASSNALLVVSVQDASGTIASGSGLAGGNWTTSSSNILQLTTDWKTYEIDFTGNLKDQYNCACDLDATQIDNITIGINPGHTDYPIDDEFGNPANQAFTGTVEIDYLHIGSQSCSLPVALSSRETAESEIYPNPTTNDLWLNKTEPWAIYTTQGTKVKSGNSAHLTVGSLPNGVYIIQTQSRFQKFIKN